LESEQLCFALQARPLKRCAIHAAFDAAAVARRQTFQVAALSTQSLDHNLRIDTNRPRLGPSAQRIRADEPLALDDGVVLLFATALYKIAKAS